MSSSSLKYPLSYAQLVWNAFYSKHTRASRQFLKNYKITKKMALYMIASNDPRWYKLKIMIKEYDRLVLTPVGAVNKHHLEFYERTILNKCVVNLADLREFSFNQRYWVLTGGQK